MFLAVLVLATNLVVVEKANHKMTLFDRGRVIKTYNVRLGADLAPKRRRGDGRTPEGR